MSGNKPQMKIIFNFKSKDLSLALHFLHKL